MIEIIVESDSHGNFSATVDNIVIVASSRTPFLSTARKLIEIRHLPNTAIQMRHKGSNTVALKSTIGAAAKLTVAEREDGLLRFENWRKYPSR